MVIRRIKRIRRIKIRRMRTRTRTRMKMPVEKHLGDVDAIVWCYY